MMRVRTIEDPSWVDALLEWRWTWLAVRLGLASAYLLGGLTKLADFSGAIAEQEHFGLHPGWLWASVTILIELGGSALVISGYLVWLGAGGLGVLTAIAALVANNFWAMPAPARMHGANDFFEHIGLIAGFVLVALVAAQRQRQTKLPGTDSPKTLH
jgi:uncharacterized membrane protein YphA (DoxX/SURF4 family)